MRESEAEFHLRRAREELDFAYRTECRAAMESHLRLSSLHMRRLRALQSTVRPTGLEAYSSTAAAVFVVPRPAGVVMAREAEAV